MQKILAPQKQDERNEVIEPQDLTLENLETALASDTKVKLAGLDIDGEIHAAIAVSLPIP